MHCQAGGLHCIGVTKCMEKADSWITALVLNSALNSSKETEIGALFIYPCDYAKSSYEQICSLEYGRQWKMPIVSTMLTLQP